MLSQLFFLFKGAIHKLNIINLFWNVGHAPIEAPLWTPSCTIRNKCPHLLNTFSVYIHQSSTLGKPYGRNLRCYWEYLEEQLGDLRNHLGIWWEHIGNKEKTQKTPLPHPPPSPIPSPCLTYNCASSSFNAIRRFCVG